MNTEKVSIIIPAYNRGYVIEKAIKSVLNQTYYNLEVIIVDDCSTDNTEQIVGAIADSRVIYKKLDQNGGAAHARNAGVELASGNLIAFQDSDDEWVEDKLEKQMAYLSQHPEFSMIYCAFTAYDSAGNEVERTPSNSCAREEVEGNILESILIQNKISTQTVLMKKECFQDISGFDESYKCLEDWEFAIRFSKKYLIGYIDESLVNVYRQADSLSAKVAEYYVYRSRMIVQYKDILQEIGIFDKVVLILFHKAEKRGILENVTKIFMSMLH